MKFLFAVLAAFILALVVNAQNVKPPLTPTETPKKANSRPAETQAEKPEPFNGASIEKMAAQCVTIETELGNIRIEMLAEPAPETVRNFLNLAATGMLDTTTFSRVVKGFVVQGGNLATSQRITPELVQRSRWTIMDEPNEIKHDRGVVSMARPDTPNAASTHFFILVGSAPQLDGKFSAFGRVASGMDIVDAINRAPNESETSDKPEKPVRILRVTVSECPK